MLVKTLRKESYGLIVSKIRCNPADVERLASDSIELSTRYSFPHWVTHGIILRNGHSLLFYLQLPVSTPQQGERNGFGGLHPRDWGASSATRFAGESAN